MCACMWCDITVPYLAGSPILGEGSSSDLTVRRSLGSLSLRSMTHQETPMGRVCWKGREVRTMVKMGLERGEGKSEREGRPPVREREVE